MITWKNGTYNKTIKIIPRKNNRKYRILIKYQISNRKKLHVLYNIIDSKANILLSCRFH